MLKILCLIAQNLNKFEDMESMCMKARYGHNEDVRDVVSYKDNVIEENNDFASLINDIPSKENIDWPFTSALTSQDPIIDLNESLKCV